MAEEGYQFVCEEAVVLYAGYARRRVVLLRIKLLRFIDQDWCRLKITKKGRPAVGSALFFPHV